MKTFKMNEVEKICGLKRTRLQWWLREGRIVPSVQRASGAGTRNIFNVRDLLIISIFKKAVDSGLPLEVVAKYLQQFGDSIQYESLGKLIDIQQPTYLMFFKIGNEFLYAKIHQYSLTSVPILGWDSAYGDADTINSVNITKIACDIQKKIGSDFFY